MPTINRKTNKYVFQNETNRSGYVTQNGFYQSWKWRKKSKLFLANNPLCVECKKLGIITQATETDHIKPISQGGEIWDNDNLQALCKSCHAKKSAKEKNK
jgi:5-methylcytosine-specific restriction protein A